jgi:D-3-phosphoglycerate dehydrogenase
VASRGRNVFLDRGELLKDNWEGAKFIGSDLRRHTLGLVGYGQVGRRVARRTLAFGTDILTFDPYLEAEPGEGVERVWTLDELLERADFVSVHARATAKNDNLFDEFAFAKMKPGRFL